MNVLKRMLMTAVLASATVAGRADLWVRVRIAFE